MNEFDLRKLTRGKVLTRCPSLMEAFSSLSHDVGYVRKLPPSIESVYRDLRIPHEAVVCVGAKGQQYYKLASSSISNAPFASQAPVASSEKDSDEDDAMPIGQLVAGMRRAKSTSVSKAQAVHGGVPVGEPSPSPSAIIEGIIKDLAQGKAASAPPVSKETAVVPPASSAGFNVETAFVPPASEAGFNVETAFVPPASEAGFNVEAVFAPTVSSAPLAGTVGGVMEAPLAPTTEDFTKEDTAPLAAVLSAQEKATISPSNLGPPDDSPDGAESAKTQVVGSPEGNLDVDRPLECDYDYLWEGLGLSEQFQRLLCAYALIDKSPFVVIAKSLKFKSLLRGRLECLAAVLMELTSCSFEDFQAKGAAAWESDLDDLEGANNFECPVLRQRIRLLGTFDPLATRRSLEEQLRKERTLSFKLSIELTRSDQIEQELIALEAQRAKLVHERETVAVSTRSLEEEINQTKGERLKSLAELAAIVPDPQKALSSTFEFFLPLP